MKKRLFIGLLILGAISFGLFTRPKNIVHAEDTRVITVHIDGEEKTVATNAGTVKEVLSRLNTKVGENDKTEPGLDESVEGNDFSINVYRARPITVVDGANNYTVMTAERSPKQIAEEAGFTTKQEDQFGFKRSDDPYAGAPGTQMVIKRSKTITFELYGVASQLNTNEVSVGDLLTERGVKLEATDELSVPEASRITEGMTVSITSVNKTVETVEEVAAFPEEQIKDAQQPLGFKKIKEPGKNGKKLVTYEAIVRNNGEPVRTAIKEVITEEPVKQIVIIGAKQAINVPGNCGEWLAQANITNSDAIWLIGKESGCNPGAVNRSSGACGIPQALPCSKLPCPLDATGAVCQIKWMENYVNNRYGSWAKARAFHASRGWY